MRLDPFLQLGLDETLLELLWREHESRSVPRLRRFWDYFRNEPSGWAEPGRARLAQESGLPQRLHGAEEVVIENDIAWRVQAMVDFMFGKPVTIVSTASDEGLRREIERTLDDVWEESGGIALLQDAALLGHVYGHVDLVLRTVAASDPTQAIRVELIEPTRAIPLLDPADYRRILAIIIRSRRDDNGTERPEGSTAARRAGTTVTEVISGDHRQVYEDGVLLLDEVLRPSRSLAPVVHIQNLAQPFRYDGLSDVEPLIPLQDELNARLSDRAWRVTMQSFKMYLARGLEGFEQMPVGPGRIWSTSNVNASIDAFGGDASSPSEESHVREIREAIDKVSGVPPLASGVVRARIGNLTSANALRVTLMGILARTARKRVSYGRALSGMSRMILESLDELGVLKTQPDDRGVRLLWPDPVPDDLHAQVRTARVKQDIGVPDERVLAELGYAPTDPGVT